MNYLKIYNRLIITRQQLARNKKNGTFENHHIVPKSLGGSNKKENLVLLTPREHFIAHWLLYSMYTGNEKAKMAYGFFRMCSNNSKQKRVVTARQYEIAKNAMRKSCCGKNSCNYGKKIWSSEDRLKISLRQRGETNSMYGRIPWNKGKKLKPHTAESREKLSIANKGKKRSDEAKRKMSEARKGMKLSDETKQKLRDINLGKKRSPESSEKTASKLRGRQQPKVTCPHCQKEGGTAMYRWHFNNCKVRKNNETNVSNKKRS